MYDSEVACEDIKFDTKPKLPKMEYKGSVSLTLKLGIEVSALAGLIVGNVGAGLKATATVSTNDLSIYPKNSANIFLPQDAVTADSIHCCDVCQKIHLGITVIAEGKLSIGWDLKDKLKIFQFIPDKINVGKALSMQM